MFRRRSLAIAVGAGLAGLALPGIGFSQVHSTEHPEALPTIDVSQDRAAALVADSLVSAAQREAAAALEQAVPGVTIRWNALTGTPARIQSTQSMLSQSAAAAPAQAIRDFVGANAALFGLSRTDLNTLAVTRDAEAPGTPEVENLQAGGLRHVALEQRWEGRQIFPTNLLGSVSSDGGLASIAGLVVSDLGEKINALEPTVAPVEAIGAAAETIGAEFAADSHAPVTEPSGAERRQTFARGAGFDADIPVRLIYFVTSPDEVRLVWEVMGGARGDPYAYQVLVDALTGDVHYRETITSEDTPQFRNVYFRVDSTPTTHPKDHYQPLDNPFPLSPGPVTADGSQGTAGPGVTLESNGDASVSPGGWLAAGVTNTTGNNVIAFVDRNGNNSADAGEQPSAALVDIGGVQTRVFDLPPDFTAAPETAGNERSATVQTFAMANWWHDRLELLGFTEAAGNFQSNNGGAGGVGGDPILARLHVGQNNSTFGTPTADGICCPTLNSYTWTGPDPDRDSGYDAEILIHEFTHGLTNRIIGGPNVRGLGGAGQPRGLGEGYSDTYALFLLRSPDEDPNATYTVGGYATFRLPPDFGQPPNWEDNYYFGIRHFPYTTDRCRSPLTLADMQPATYDITPLPAWGCSGTPPVSPWLQNRSGGPHDMGEVWAASLWEVRRNLVTKHGAAAGNELALQLVTDSLFGLQRDPSFIDARDAVLVADLARTGGANRCAIWRGFAKRGFGTGAATPTAGSFTEDFAFPEECPAEEPPDRVASFHYAAKIVCGIAKDPEDFRLTPGLYATTVNIHNPGEEDVRFTKTLALTFPPKEQKPGESKEFATDTLPPGLALATDCDDLRERVFGGSWPTPYVEGFVILDSTGNLDVVGVYTKSALNPEAGAAIDVEPVSASGPAEPAPSGKPDLLPVDDANQQFCHRGPNGLEVTVRNQGAGPAGASKTRVDFGSHGSATGGTPALGIGADAATTVPIPFGCFDPDCEFRIVADDAGEIDEENEANNIASGFCLG